MLNRWTPPARAAGARVACAPAVAFALAACAPDPVAWNPELEQRVDAVAGAVGLPPGAPALPPNATVDAADTLVRRLVTSIERGASTETARPAAPASNVPGAASTAGASTAGAYAVDTVRVVALPPDPLGTRCPASLRLARAPRAARPLAADPASGTDGAVAVWWAYRADRSAALYASRTNDGGRTWGAPVAVDTLDRSEAGCERPAPSVAADSVNGYIHVAYSMDAPEGAGVFYAHQMDRRARFEPPQAIVYGDRPAATSVASKGERVVVAYEDPNTGGRPFVSIALSRTAGHAWAERVPVTAGSVAAERPTVALRGRDQVLLGWVERTAPRTVASTDDPRVAVAPLPSGVVVRVGRLRE